MTADRHQAEIAPTASTAVVPNTMIRLLWNGLRSDAHDPVHEGESVIQRMISTPAATPSAAS